MDNTKELNEMFYDKMSAEYEEFIEKLYQMEPKEIIQSAYEKVFKEDILNEYIFHWQSIENVNLQAAVLGSMFSALECENYYSLMTYLKKFKIESVIITIDSKSGIVEEWLGKKDNIFPLKLINILQ